MITQNYKDKIREEELMIYDPELKTSRSIWHGANPSNIIFDNEGNQIAFYTAASPESSILDILHVIRLNTREEKKVTLQELSKAEGMTFYPYTDGRFRFSNDGKRLFFSIQKANEPVKPKNDVKITVWNYQDPKLQSVQSYIFSLKQEYFYSYIINQQHSILLTREFERVSYNIKFNKSYNDDYIVVERIEGDQNESYWNPKSKQRVILVSAITGERKIIQQDSQDYLLNIEISPNGNFIIFYNSGIHTYQCYQIKTHEVINLNASIKTNWNSFPNSLSSKIPSPVGVSFP